MALPKIYQKLLERLPLSGGTMTGTLVVAQGSNSIDGGVANGRIQINANGNSGGGQLRLFGSQSTDSNGGFRLWANNGTTEVGLVGEADGSLRWGGKPVLCGESGGFPVGFLALYAGSNVPDGWFRCDGSTIADMATNYPKLYAVLGTNVLPNYTGKTIFGAISDINQQVAAGLPNIIGTFAFNAGSTVALWSAVGTGAFSSVKHPETSLKGGVYNSPSTPYQGNNSVSFNASRSSSIYGASQTVQPPAVKVAFLIRHD